MNESENMAGLAVKAINDKLGNDITVIDISRISTLGDYFIITDGRNKNQVQAISDAVEETLGRHGYDMKAKDGYSSASWILLDYRDVIIHIFDHESRSFYSLERLWKDGENIDYRKFL